MNKNLTPGDILCIWAIYDFYMNGGSFYNFISVSSAIKMFLFNIALREIVAFKENIFFVLFFIWNCSEGNEKLMENVG